MIRTLSVTVKYPPSAVGGQGGIHIDSEWYFFFSKLFLAGDII